MEVIKRCGNCYKYPFCNKCNNGSGCCEEWMKKEKYNGENKNRISR